MPDLKQSSACGKRKVCGYLVFRSTQLMTQCPKEFYCGNETTMLNQYLTNCVSGSYCIRGTTKKLNASNDVPSAEMNLNPCLTWRMILDISNIGRKYSGKKTVIRYTLVSYNSNPSYNVDHSHKVPPTHATYKLTPKKSLNLFEAKQGIIQVKHLRASLAADCILCCHSLVHKERCNLGEEGWFE
jgi:hypothetical protein